MNTAKRISLLNVRELVYVIEHLAYASAILISLGPHVKEVYIFVKIIKWFCNLSLQIYVQTRVVGEELVSHSAMHHFFMELIIILLFHVLETVLVLNIQNGMQIMSWSVFVITGTLDLIVL